MSSPQRARETASTRVGSILRNKWRLDALLGAGRTQVYAATHRNGQRAAIKILPRTGTQTDRVLEGARLINVVGHPGLVEVQDDDVTEDGDPFVVLELLEGETLHQMWQGHERQIPLPLLLRQVTEVVESLGACHAKGLVHHEISPKKIFITKRGAPKILDCLVSIGPYPRDLSRGGPLGDPYYMAPEQAMGLGDEDGRADLFAVGAILFQLLSGQRIHRATSDAEALVIAATTPAPSLAKVVPHLTEDLVYLVDRALSWDKRNRFPNASEMQRHMLSILERLEAHPVTRKPAPRAPRTEVPHERDPSLPPAARHPSSLSPLRRASSASFGRESSPGLSRSPSSLGRSASSSQENVRIAVTRELLRQMEKVLSLSLEFGPQHALTARATRKHFESLSLALTRDEDALFVDVRPFAWERQGHSVWEPAAPHDVICYQVYAAGVRNIRILPGVTEPDLVAWLLLLSHAGSASEDHHDDLVTEAFERGLSSVVLTTHLPAPPALYPIRAWEETWLEGGAYVPESLRVIEHAAFDIGTDDWGERHVDLLSDALIDGAIHEDAKRLLQRLRGSSADLMSQGRPDIVRDLALAIGERLEDKLSPARAAQLSTALRHALFGGEALVRLLRVLAMDPALLSEFRDLLLDASPRELPTVLSAMRTPLPEPLLDALTHYVERVLVGQESLVFGALEGLLPTITSRLLAAMSHVRSQGALEGLSALRTSQTPHLRVQATLYAEENLDRGGLALARLLDLGDEPLRTEVIAEAMRVPLRSMAPYLLSRVRSPLFGDLTAEERALTCDALLVLDRELGEPMLVDLARQSHAFSSASHAATRLMAIERLGRLGQSPDTLAMLRTLSVTEWGESDDVKEASAISAEQIRLRLSRGVEGGAR